MDQLATPLQETWDECKAVFGDDNILIVSNSAGSSKDPDALAAENVSSNLGVPVLCHPVKKPGKACAKQVVDYIATLALHSADPTLPPHILVIGDRITTDMAFADQIQRQLTSTYPHMTATCTSILTRELWGAESFGTRMMRAMEYSILRRLTRLGIPSGGGWSDRTPSALTLEAWERTSPASVPAQMAAMPELPARRTIIARILSHRWIAPWVAKAQRIWHAIVRETFASVQHIRELTWSVFTAAPTRQWKSTWRRPSPLPRPGSSWTRRMSTCAVRREPMSHEKPVPRRSAPAEPGHTPATSSPVWFGIPRIRWVLALVTLMILPLGFWGGMKLSEWVDRRRAGNLTHEGEGSTSLATQPPFSPAPAPAIAPVPDEVDAAPTRAQIQKKLSRYVLYWLTITAWSWSTSICAENAMRSARNSLALTSAKLLVARRLPHRHIIPRARGPPILPIPTAKVLTGSLLTIVGR